MKTKLSYLAALVILIIVVALGYQILSKRQEIPGPPALVEPDSSDFVEYKNEELGISMRIPKFVSTYDGTEKGGREPVVAIADYEQDHLCLAVMSEYNWPTAISAKCRIKLHIATLLGHEENILPALEKLYGSFTWYAKSLEQTDRPKVFSVILADRETDEILPVSTTLGMVRSPSFARVLIWPFGHDSLFTLEENNSFKQFDTYMFESISITD